MELEERTRGEEFFRGHYDELLNKYPNEWVAIFNGDIVGHDRIHRLLIKSLRGQRLFHAYIDRTYVREKPPAPRTRVSL